MAEVDAPARRDPGPGPCGGTLAAVAPVLTGAAGIWLGIQGLRLFLTMVVWNVAEDQPATRMALWALGVYLPGLLAWVPARWVGGPRPAWRFGLWLAVLTVLRQARFAPVWTPALAFAGWVAWLWWWPAFLQELVRRGAPEAVVPGIFLGLMAQVAGQTALSGLDLPYLRSPGALVATVVQAGVLVLALGLWHRWSGRPPAAAEGEEAGIALGAAVTGPFLFLQLTWLANLGRVAMLGGWDLPAAALFIQAGLAAGLLGSRLPIRSRLLRLCLAALAVVLALPGERLSGRAVWLLWPLQFGLGAALGAAWAPAPHPLADPARPARAVAVPGELPASGPRGRVYGGAAAGWVLVFVLLFLFYSRYGWPALWPVAAALAALPLAVRRPWPADLSLRPALALAAVAAAVTLGAGYLPGTRTGPIAARAPAELKVLDYNIHNGLDSRSLPSMEALAEVIASADPDLVALQEVNRGWDLSGGVDLAAWLRRRFPQYHLVYGPMNGPLWGNVILSRYPVVAWGTVQYPRGASDFPRGLVWARLETAAGDLLFVSTHLTAYAGFDADRTREAEALAAFWQGRPRAVIAGDFNAHPGDPAIARVRSAGLVDVPAVLGQGETFTYAADHPYERIDYVFASPDVTPVNAAVSRALASDHLPVVVTVRLR